MGSWSAGEFHLKCLKIPGLKHLYEYGMKKIGCGKSGVDNYKKDTKKLIKENVSISNPNPKASIVADRNTEQAEKNVKKISNEIAETDKKIKSKYTELERIDRNIIDKKLDIKKAKVTTTNSNSKLVIETK